VRPEQAHEEDVWAALRPRPAAPRLKPIDAAPARPEPRPISLTGVALLALLISIGFAALTVALALVYRAQVGPGMAAGPAALGVEPTAGPTLQPTFTPTVPRSGSPSPLPILPVPAVTPSPVATPTIAVLLRVPADGPPTRLVIPVLSLDIPVLPVGVKTVRSNGRVRTVWSDVPNAGAFHRSSAYPGRPGNTVINGHRDIQGSVFRHLDRLRPGDEIVLYVGEVAYAYRVAEILIVPETFASPEQRADNTRLIGYYPEERLTLVTCTPPGLATHRLLVIARPAEPQMPEAGSTAVP
jgi:sortase A